MFENQILKNVLVTVFQNPFRVADNYSANEDFGQP